MIIEEERTIQQNHEPLTLLEYSRELEQQAFVDAPLGDDEQWMGDLIIYPDNVGEFIPFQMGSKRFFCFFTTTSFLVDSDPDVVAELAQGWSNGYVPLEEERIVKFFRVDCASEDELFKPESWKLNDPRQIFQFFELLAEIIKIHFEQTQCSGYYYLPAQERLIKIYQRCSNKIAQALAPSAITFSKVDDVGDFYGYRKD